MRMLAASARGEETLVRLGTGLILGVIGIICQFVSTRKD